MITAASSGTIRPILGKLKQTDSPVALYTARETAAPSFSVAAGGYAPAQTIVISSATEGATIRYTVEETDPILAMPLLPMAHQPRPGSLPTKSS